MTDNKFEGIDKTRCRFEERSRYFEFQSETPPQNQYECQTDFRQSS